MAKPKEAPPPRKKSFTAYPLFVTPQRWRAKPEEIDALVDLSQIESNFVQTTWGGRPSQYAAISAGRDGSLVNIRLVRLKKDSIDKIDIKRLKEEILSPGENEYFGDTAALVLDPTVGLAIGEYRPEAVRVLGEMPGRLMNQAFISAGRQDRIEFHPFPAPTFKEVVKGKSISKYYLDLGPASVQQLERMGFDASSIKQIVRDDSVVSLRVQIKIQAAAGTTPERIMLLEGLADKMRSNQSKSFRVVTEDSEVYDLIRSNFVRFTSDVELAKTDGEEAERLATFAGLGQLLKDHRTDLKSRIPPAPKPIEDFVHSE
jgi:plasmid maintenance system antidote protein VapI